MAHYYLKFVFLAITRYLRFTFFAITHYFNFPQPTKSRNSQTPTFLFYHIISSDFLAKVFYSATHKKIHTTRKIHTTHKIPQLTNTQNPQRISAPKIPKNSKKSTKKFCPLQNSVKSPLPLQPKIKPHRVIHTFIAEVAAVF